MKSGGKMKIIEYFSSSNKEFYLSKIGESDWSAGKYLYHLLKEDRLKELVGEKCRVLMLTNGEELISFCTLAELDDIQPTDLSPWIGFIYTFPQYRGNRYATELLAFAEHLAHTDGAERVYISTNHIGLYEKYGYNLYGIMKDVDGEDSRVYFKDITHS